MGARRAARGRGSRLEGAVKFEAQVGGETIPVEVSGANGRYRVEIGSTAWDVDARTTGADGWSLLLGRESWAVGVTDENGLYVVDVDGEVYRIRVEEETRYIIRTRGSAATAGGQILKAPMPGRVVLVEVSVGQAVQAGDGLVILEAMKMENELRAPVRALVRAVRVRPGQAVERGQVLVEFDGTAAT
jgi:acetyl/propionyl-CoA carboxylase alpha subunit